MITLAFQITPTNANSHEEEKSRNNEILSPVSAIVLEKPLDLERLYDVNNDSSEDEDEWSSEMEKAFFDHKRCYYQDKLKYDHVTPEVLRQQAIDYVTAIQWNLRYYYDGCASWSWYYPHHSSPYLSDVTGFADVQVKFDLGPPFLPVQQLLAVLPAQSRKLLPAAYQDLMTSENSPIIRYYPNTFQTDLNGKKQDWEAVVLIPFIDEERLLNAMKPRDNLLSDEERRRNSYGQVLLFTTVVAARRGKTSPTNSYPSSCPGFFPDIKQNLAQCTKFDRNAFNLESDRIVKGLLPNVKLDAYFAGFPTFKHIPLKNELKRMDVRVFQSCSKNESMVLTVQKRPGFDASSQVAQRLVGKEVYVYWPYLSKALACSFVTRERVFTQDYDGNLRRRITDLDHFERDERSIRLRYFETRAIDVGPIDAVIYVRPLMGTRYVCNNDGTMRLEKEYAEVTVPFALQTIIEKDANKPKTLAVNPRVLFSPNVITGNILPDNKADFRVLDRVVNVRTGMAVPLGLRGTVISIQPINTSNNRPNQQRNNFGMDFKLCVVFDEEFMGGCVFHGTKKNGYRMPPGALLNLSYGWRIETEKRRVKNYSSPQLMSNRRTADTPLRHTSNHQNDAERGTVQLQVAPDPSVVPLPSVLENTVQINKGLEQRKTVPEAVQLTPMDLPTWNTVTAGPTAVASNSKQKTASVPHLIAPSPSNQKFAQPVCYIPPSSSEVDALAKNPTIIFDKAKNSAGLPSSPFNASSLEDRRRVNKELKDMFSQLDLNSVAHDRMSEKNLSQIELKGTEVANRNEPKMIGLPENPKESFSSSRAKAINPDASVFSPGFATEFVEHDEKAKSRGLIKSTEERTKTDKLRELRRKKKLAKLKAKRDEERDRRVKVPKDKLKMLQKLGKIHKVKTDVPKKSSKSKSARR